MLALPELQSLFRAALLGGDAAVLATLVAEDGVPAAARLAIHSNNVMASLTGALAANFPAVQRLVGERFFAYAAHEFIERHPPERVALAEYGALLPDFLAAFAPCRELVYLADVARLEWLILRAAHAEDARPLPPSALAGIAAEDTPRIVLRLKPSRGFLASPFPVDRLWRANAEEEAGDGAIDLAAGGVRLEVSRRGERVVLRLLDAARFAFRRSLAAGETLGEAAEAALAAADDVDLAAGLADLFRDEAVIGVTLAHPLERPS
jgi:hypothetical protein